jgi:predicted metal-dependent hydrolase
VIFRRRTRAVRREQSLCRLDMDGEPVDYLLKRSSARRSLSLRVNAEGMAQVNSPWTMSSDRIESFLRQHADWLKTQLSRSRTEPVWSNGLPLPFLGKDLEFEWRPVAQHKAVRRVGDRLVCEAPAGHQEPAVVDWYRDQAASYLADRLTRICALLAHPVPRWRLSDARTRWGSLSAKGVVSLNWRLIKASPDEIDYVICHELAHFRRRDHSPAFWRAVAAMYPEFQAMRYRLRVHGARYMEF